MSALTKPESSTYRTHRELEQALPWNEPRADASRTLGGGAGGLRQRHRESGARPLRTAVRCRYGG